MPDNQFAFMQTILGAPSPIGFEGAMTYGILKPYFESIRQAGWAIHQFKGNAGIVLDTHPNAPERCSVMIIGHADKIRLQVRSIGDDGKIWVNSDSFLPGTLIGHEVLLFSEDPKHPGRYRVLRGGTIEALGAIHFASMEQRKGSVGIKPDMLYLELQLHGESPRQHVEALGIRPGDPILLNRTIRRGFATDTFYGAYLDNGLGCFATAEVARLVSESKDVKNLRVMFAIAAYEEIGRFGSRVLAGELQPDVVIGVDVNHDYRAAPGVTDRRFPPLAMGKGLTLTSGSIASEFLNTQIEIACRDEGIPLQKSPSGRDTGNDAMAAVLAAVDAAATSVGIPIRNMHTISEIGHTGDVIACIHALHATLRRLDAENEGTGITRDDFRRRHPRLDQGTVLAHKVPT